MRGVVLTYESPANWDYGPGEWTRCVTERGGCVCFFLAQEELGQLSFSIWVPIGPRGSLQFVFPTLPLLYCPAPPHNRMTPTQTM